MLNYHSCGVSAKESRKLYYLKLCLFGNFYPYIMFDNERRWFHVASYFFKKYVLGC